MGLPVTVYRSTDAGAPGYDGRPSSVIDILRKCLVDGYGSKPGLGWSVAFEDVAGLAIAFRNDPTVGTGGYLKVWSAGGDSVDTNIKINCCKDMTDIDTLIAPAGYRVMDLYASRQFSWQLIGTSRGAWFSINSSYQNALDYDIGSTSMAFQVNYFFGDIDSSSPNDVGAFTLLSSNNTMGDSDSTVYLYTIGANSKMYCSISSADGSDPSLKQYVAEYPYATTIVSYYDDPESVGSPHTLLPFQLTINNDTWHAPSATYPGVRGTIPGLYCSQHYGYCNKPYPFDLVLNGMTFTPIRGQFTPTAWINMDEWYV